MTSRMDHYIGIFFYIWSLAANISGPLYMEKSGLGIVGRNFTENQTILEVHDEE